MGVQVRLLSRALSHLMMIRIAFRLSIFCLLAACSQPATTPVEPRTFGESDEKSAALIEQAEAACGGLAVYDDLQILKWNFFGFRDLIWNKASGDVRIDIPRDTATFLLNLQTGQGKVRIAGTEVTHPDSLSAKLEQARRIWINDSYWLVMPFKMRDPGVTASYVGRDTTQDGRTAEVIALTFEKVGVTPQNKYHVWLDDESQRVCQWSFYPNAQDEEPRAIWPWDNYQKVQNDPPVWLSFDRSDGKGPKEVKLYSAAIAEVFSSFDSPEDGDFSL